MRAELEEALETLRKKESGGMERALELLQKTVFSFSMKVCGQREDAEDTTQETLLSTVSHLPRFDSPKALGVWLYKVAKSRCLMSRRKSKFAPPAELSLEVLMPNREHLEREVAGDVEAPDSAVLRKEREDRLQRAILKLPPSFRLVLVLHDMEELSTEEVARVTGLREGTVRVRLHRARAFLRNELTGGASKRSQDAERHAPPDGRCRKLFAELSDYLDGELDPSLCPELETHLGNCKPCQAFLKSLERTVKGLRRHRAPALDPEAAARIRAEVAETYREAIERSRAARRV